MVKQNQWTMMEIQNNYAFLQLDSFGSKPPLTATYLYRIGIVYVTFNNSSIVQTISLQLI